MKQFRFPLTIARCAQIVALTLTVSFALTRVASASEMSSAYMHKAKKGSFTIANEIEVGGIVLQPGDYEVKEINSPGGPTVEIVHLFENVTAPEGLPIYDQEVVGQVRITEQALSPVPEQTRLRLASTNAKALALQIRGDNVEYLFDPQALPSSAASGQ